MYIFIQFSLIIFPHYIPSPSLNRHSFSFTKVQLSLYLMFNFTLF